MEKHNARLIVLLNKNEKDALEKEANQRGLPLGSYARMILIGTLKKDDNDMSRRI